MQVLDWLLAGDPAIRWQALRDLTGAAPEEIAAARARVADEGWGARLLAARDDDGQWAGGAHFPASGWPEGTAQPWTSTSHALTLLRLFGVEPAAMQDTVALIGANCRWEYDDLPYWGGEVEPCINGQLVANGAYLGVDVSPVVDRLLGERLPDGGWNCEAERGSTRSSFHTTIDVLEGLAEFERQTGSSAAVTEARHAGEEYLLERSLLRRCSTGAVIDKAWLDFSFPPRWRYDVLRALDHLRDAGTPVDGRAAEAIELVRDRRAPDGRWPLENSHPGAVTFELEDGDGRPSRWNTLRALRVLRWAGS